MTMMTQCRMERNGFIDNAWIEAKLALKDIVDIKINGVWQRGWRILSRGTTLDSKVVAERERDFKTHRKSTDI